MLYSIRGVGYFYTTIKSQPGTAYELLSGLAGLGVNLLAFSAVPMGPGHTQLTLFPEDETTMEVAAEKTGLVLDGPHPALLVNGDDELGALASIHQRLRDVNVDVFASTGVTDGQGRYGYVIYVRPDEYEKAATALDVA